MSSDDTQKEILETLQQLRDEARQRNRNRAYDIEDARNAEEARRYQYENDPMNPFRPNQPKAPWPPPDWDG